MTSTRIMYVPSRLCKESQGYSPCNTSYNTIQCKAIHHIGHRVLHYTTTITSINHYLMFTIKFSFSSKPPHSLLQIIP